MTTSIYFNECLSQRDILLKLLCCRKNLLYKFMFTAMQCNSNIRFWIKRHRYELDSFIIYSLKASAVGVSTENITRV